MSDSDITIRQGAYLPHWTKEGASYFVTFHLGDSIPQTVLEQWKYTRDDILGRAKQQGRLLSSEELTRLAVLREEKIERYLDVGHGACWMKRDDIAAMVSGAVQFFADKRYTLFPWSVMPNHVHITFRPLPSFTLPGILQSWKSYTSHEANKILGRQGDFWHRESYDHLIRDEDDFNRCAAYVLANAVRAGLHDWPWQGLGSAGVPPAP